MERLRRRERARYGHRVEQGGDMAETSSAFLDWAASYDTAGPEQRSRVAHEAWLAARTVPVLRLDSSEPLEMLKGTLGGDSRVRYELSRIEDVELPDRSVDVVISGLALHYVGDFVSLSNRVGTWLRDGGSFVFSVEHPIVTCASREWAEAPDGARLHWPVDCYLDEGARLVRWLGTDTPREHRTIASYMNAMIDAGLIIRRLLEPGPDPASLKQWPKLADHKRRPSFLIIRADR
jgi:SAM-dependent methyltransferase